MTVPALKKRESVEMRSAKCLLRPELNMEHLVLSKGALSGRLILGHARSQVGRGKAHTLKNQKARTRRSVEDTLACY